MSFIAFIRRPAALVAVLTAALALSACGAPREAETVAPESLSMTERLAAHGSFDTLVAAIETAELDSVLDGPGVFTFFAPTDAAFAALPPGTVESLLQPDRRDELVALLSHHFVVAEVTSAGMGGRVQVITTYLGDLIELDGRDGRLMVDGVPISQPDIVARNGVIHAIDGVLIP